MDNRAFMGGNVHGSLGGMGNVVCGMWLCGGAAVLEACSGCGGYKFPGGGGGMGNRMAGVSYGGGCSMGAVKGWEPVVLDKLDKAAAGARRAGFKAGLAGASVKNMYKGYLWAVFMAGYVDGADEKRAKRGRAWK